MSWYYKDRDESTKLYLEWVFHEEVEPIPGEPGFYRAKKMGLIEYIRKLLRPRCEYCGKRYKEYADAGPRICPECLWETSEINPKNRPQGG